MKLIDTHNHLYLENFDPEQEVLVNAARESGIDTLLLPNVDVETIGRMHDLCDRFPDFAYPMMGLHPTSVDGNYAGNLKTTESYLGKRAYCGIGEIGYFREFSLLVKPNVTGDGRCVMLAEFILISFFIVIKDIPVLVDG